MSELDEEAQQLLSLARSARTPDANDRARVARRLGLAAGISASAASSAAMAQASGTLKAGAASGVWKLGAAGIAIFSAAVGGYLTLQPAAAPVQPQKSQPATAQHVDASPARVMPEPDATPVPQTPALRPAPRRAERSDTLVQELELLHRAQAAWRASQAERALELVKQHGERFPRSQLREERETLEVLTLCKLGRAREAGRVARTLFQRSPQSPARAAIEESCALE
jgi:hypothetical protein